MTKTADRSDGQFVTYSSEFRWSDLWKTEDYWAVWIGFFLIAVGLAIYLTNPPVNLDTRLDAAEKKLFEESNRAPFHTLAWYQASDTKGKIKATNAPYAKTIKRWTHKPHKWSENPLEAFWRGPEATKIKKEQADKRYLFIQETLEELKSQAATAEATAGEAGFKYERLNRKAQQAIAEYLQLQRKAKDAKRKTLVQPYNQVGYLVVFGFGVGLLFAIGMQVMSRSGLAFLKGFPLIFGLAVLAYTFAAQVNVEAAGIGYAAWAILIGLLVSHTLGTPQWARPAIQVEYYIKSGLVILGAENLFGKVLVIGLPGIFVAWVVTPVVLLATYWFGQHILKMTSKTLNITICADMSVCGVSAAIATAAACRAKKEELTLAVGLSLAFTAVMMVVMPNVIRAMGMDHVLGGAWMGGTIDATGAAAAAGAFLSERALYVAATIKMIQNILIGVIAFGVAFYWVTRVERDSGRPKPSVVEIWHRFPKFIIGFVIASILFSLIYETLGHGAGEVIITHGVIKGWTKIWRGWFFCLAFVSIGLATDFRELGHYFKGGKPLVLYICGQTLNLILTLVMAYFMFFVVFPEITITI